MVVFCMQPAILSFANLVRQIKFKLTDGIVYEFIKITLCFMQQYLSSMPWYRDRQASGVHIEHCVKETT